MNMSEVHPTVGNISELPADPFGLRHGAILEIFLAAGIRLTEIANLSPDPWSDIQEKKHLVSI